MPKKSIAGLELAAIINELQFLVKGKISQIYHQEKKELLFQLHAPGRGKQLLKIVPGKFLCLTDVKDAPTRPSGFCMQLRKYLSNAFIKSLYQKDAERIVVFELEKKEKFFLIIELFSKGNMVMTDEQHKIIATLEWQKWKDRTVKPGEKYVFPESNVNWKNLSGKELFRILEKSEKKNLATSLATETGLGGLYAEEVCLRAGIDKDILPKEVKFEEVGFLAKAIKELNKVIEHPRGFIYENEITPFALMGQKNVKTLESYNEAINTIDPFEVISPYEQKIKILEGRIKQQKEAISEQKKKIELNKQKGELIYQKYSPLQKLLDIVGSLRKEGKEWSEISKELKKEKSIKGVNLKDKKVTIGL